MDSPSMTLKKLGHRFLVFTLLITFFIPQSASASSIFAPLASSWTQFDKLIGSDTDIYDEFGTAVAISGDTMVIGAPIDDQDSGTVYVFERPNGEWVEVAKLTASDRLNDDYFGNAVAIDGDTVVVGSFGSGSMKGAAYVFQRDKGGQDNWGQAAKLTASDGQSTENSGDALGISVAVSGDTVVAGSYLDSYGTGMLQGSVYVFVEGPSGWGNMTETAKLTASDSAAGDLFGKAVAIYGDTIVVGLMLDKIGSSSGQGSVYVYERPVGGWSSTTETAHLTASDGAAGDYFGTSVATDGRFLVVGSTGTHSRGAAYVYEVGKGGWSTTDDFDAKLTTPIAGVDGAVGESVAISGDVIVVGAPNNQGGAYLYQKSGSAWVSATETIRLSDAGDAYNDEFGTSVAVSSAAVLVGAPGDTTKSGAAYVFDLASDLEVSTLNDTSDSGSVGTSFTWTHRISNTDNGSVIFGQNEIILQDDLPLGPTYGSISIRNQVDISGDIHCYYRSEGSGTTLYCAAGDNGVVIGAETGRFDVRISVMPQTAGALTNPDSGGICRVDPDDLIIEDDETNNECNSNTVNVIGATEIDVLGNSNSIADGDTTPDTSDGTDFGTTEVTGGKVSKTFTIKNLGVVDLTLSNTPIVDITAPSAFTVTSQPASSTVAASGGTVSFTVEFDPVIVGTHTATVSIANDDSDENPYTFRLQGIGASAPGATTDSPPINLTSTGAMLLGTVNANNSDTAVTFEYGTTTAYGSTITAEPGPVTGNTDTSVYKDITGLIPRTTYHYRVVAVNGYGTTNGADASFTTAAAAPAATTNAATAIIADGATLNGTVNAHNDDTTVSFEYGTTSAYGTTVAAAQNPLSGASDTDVSAVISGLSSGVSYHYRVAATNSSGTSYGADMTVTIAPLAEINVTGKGVDIADGDTTPSADDDTEFGYVPTGSSLSHTFTIENKGTAELDLTGSAPDLVTISGAHAADFTVTTQPGSPVAAGSDTSFTVEFSPSDGGYRTATISIASSDSDENPYTFAIRGSEADTPEIVFGSLTYPTLDATLSLGITHLTLEFNVDVKGSANPESANSLDNYLLFSQGKNKAFDTVDCAGGVITDDVNVPIFSASYDDHDEAGPFIVTLAINNDQPLPRGKYRLLVCGTTSIENHAGIELNGGADTALDFTVLRSSTGSGSGSSSGSAKANSAADADGASMPETGYTQGFEISLPKQPSTATYDDIAMTLSIPKLALSLPIVGVPETASGWDVTWLGDSAGYLAGTAYPTWQGNTVLTGHVWDANNNPGPFAELKTLQYGDQVQLLANGKVYTYEVRESSLTQPDNLEDVFKHEEYDWVTLVTCETYNSSWGNYDYRRVVRAVLVSVE